MDGVIKVFKNLEYNNYLIVSHISPDGDNVGSTLALRKILLKMGKNVTIYNPDPIPEMFSFLDGYDSYRHELNDSDSFDVAVVLDNSEERRIGPHWRGVSAFSCTIQIDHHTSVPRFGDVVVIDEEASAVGEMLYFLAEKLNIIDKDIAEALYVSILTDTGSFRFSNTTPKTFYVASKLIEAGATPWKINVEIYENMPEEKIYLLQKVLSTLQLNNEKNVALMTLPLSMQTDPSNGSNLTEGFVNYGRSIKGVDISCFLREVEKDFFSVSLRSKDSDVSKIAREFFNGGGHIHAAGGRIAGNLNELIPYVLGILTNNIQNC
ncbi:bifunctional oligoribonuclease/PAP phosphatase NrnA [bacterium]|nr:bifunctional oligoribonuclease/PAP phosphatase NrnA [bacterium]